MGKNEGKIIVTVHCDLVWKAAGVRFLRRKGRRYFAGNLDNVVGAATVLRSVMPRVRDRDVKFYFTSEEETTMNGAKAVMKKEGRALYIAVDVTHASRNSDVNIEWIQNIDKRLLQELLWSIPKVKVGFRTGHPDETSVYGKRYPTFSVNLPLEGNMHGQSRVSFWKVRRFGLAVVEILGKVRSNYDRICESGRNQ